MMDRPASKAIDFEDLATKLNNQDYASLMADNCLYEHFNNPLTRTATLEWVKRGALDGHVPMIYLLLRNYYKALCGGAALEEEKWADIGTYLLLGWIRVFQDERYCNELKIVRLSQSPVGDYMYGQVAFVVSFAMSTIGRGNKDERDATTIFRDKCKLWFDNDCLNENIPFLQALHHAQAWFMWDEQSVRPSLPLIRPEWAKYIYQKDISLTGRVVFESIPESTLLHEYSKDQVYRGRKAYCYEALQFLASLKTWRAFFDFISIQKRVGLQGDTYASCTLQQIPGQGWGDEEAMITEQQGGGQYLGYDGEYGDEYAEECFTEYDGEYSQEYNQNYPGEYDQEYDSESAL